MSIEHQPSFTKAQAELIASDHFGIDAEAVPLPSDRDQNFSLSTPAGARYVLKIANPLASADRLAFENRLMRVASKAIEPIATPVAISARNGEDIVPIRSDAHPDFVYHVRLLEWVPGKQLAYYSPHTPELFRTLGSCLGRIAVSFSSVKEVGRSTSPEWNLMAGEETVRRSIDHISDPAQRALVERFLSGFVERARPRLGELPQQVVHADANDHNILVSTDASGGPTLSGLIDFGDAATSYRIADLAIAAAYGMFEKSDPLAAAEAMVRGFAFECPLQEVEADLLFDLICMRLCTSVVLSARRAESEPGNEYISISETQAWSLLEKLGGISPNLARYRLRSAAGLEANPESARVTAWLKSKSGEMAPICDVDLTTAPLTVFDLSVESGDPLVLQEESEATSMLFGRLELEQSSAGIGRYDEARLVYNAPQFAIDGWEGRRFRTIHIGVDIFLKPGRRIHSPLEGTVEIVDDENAPQSYGPVVVVKHSPAGCPSFYTLYGHLSRECLGRLRRGDRLASGDVIGEVGTADVNGGWTPHVHFQIITDLLGIPSGFPGVAPADQRDVWRSLCPDPNLILGIPDSLLAPPAMSGEAILTERERLLAPSLSLSYDKPLHIVRGTGTRLYDRQGRVYLDCVNNVNHVGHGRAEVVDAAANQMRVLNTNTRYLHENIVRYAARLTATLPESLDTCFFVNSGSEANDLALRLARQFTGRQAMVVLDGAYHGHLSSLIPLSPYKFDGPGGTGRTRGVYVASLPDIYRGKQRGPNAAEAYAADVAARFDEASEEEGAAGFLFESMLSCGGQIDPPPGYLEAACRAVRLAGGVCIADEVQTGFGRVGETFWAFQRQGIVPDIVTMGKPIGNGHPLGAVVTTRAIAEAFANGMEYFNTYGGNPVSCAVGLAVLDIVERDGLQVHARTMGSRLLSELSALASDHPCVGDVRGSGLFLGIELVDDPAERTPAPLKARYLVNRARRLGVLLSTDGPEHNVIKIKPPMVFSNADADELLAALRTVLREDPCRG